MSYETTDAAHSQPDTSPEQPGKRLALFVNNNLTGNLLANLLIPRLRKLGIEPVLFILNPSVSDRATIPPLESLSFYDGTIGRDTIFPLQACLSRNPSALRKGFPSYQAVSYQDLASSARVDMHEYGDVHLPYILRKIEDDKTLIGGLSIRNLQIFKPEIIDIFNRKGFFWNLHSGLLPKYRGVMPQLRAMFNDESYCGWTLHEIDSGIDTGRVLSSSLFPLRKDQAYLTQFFEKIPAAIPLIESAVETQLHGGFVSSHLPSKDTTGLSRYFTFPTVDECKEFKERGIKLVDPSEMAEIYCRHYAPPNSPLSVFFRRVVRMAINERENPGVNPSTESSMHLQQHTPG